MEDYINIARRIRYNASDEDVKRDSSSSCILVPDVFASCNVSLITFVIYARLRMVIGDSVSINDGRLTFSPTIE